MELTLLDIKRNFPDWDLQNVENVNLEKVKIKNLEHDSRKIANLENPLFIIAKGPNFDPHDFIDDAFEESAVAAFCEEGKLSKVKSEKPLIVVEDTDKALIEFAQYIRSRIEAPVIAITGSTGKTTVRSLLRSILEQRGKVITSPWGTNVNTLWGNLEWLSHYDDEDYVVMEVSMDRLGEIAEQCEAFEPDIGGILNIGTVHAGPLGGTDLVVQAKREIADYLDKKDRPVVLNFDNEKILSFVGDLDTEVISFGKHPRVDYPLYKVRSNKDGTQFKLIDQEEAKDIKLNIYGKDYAYNATMAYAIARRLEITTNEAIAGLEKFTGYPHRFELKKLTKKIYLVDDAYNANPQSMKMSIDTFNNIFPKGRFHRVAFLGDMKELGDTAAEAHETLGQQLENSNLDEIYYLGDFYKEVGVGERVEQLDEVVDKVKELISEYKESNKRLAILLKASHSVGFWRISGELGY